MPVKVGLSLADYYELNTGTTAAPVFDDNKFGYFSVAGLVTVPLGGTTSFGAWNLHGGVEFQALGDTTKCVQRRRLAHRSLAPSGSASPTSEVSLCSISCSSVSRCSSSS